MFCFCFLFIVFFFTPFLLLLSHLCKSFTFPQLLSHFHFIHLLFFLFLVGLLCILFSSQYLLKQRQQFAHYCRTERRPFIGHVWPTSPPSTHTHRHSDTHTLIKSIFYLQLYEFKWFYDTVECELCSSCGPITRSNNGSHCLVTAPVLLRHMENRGGAMKKYFKYFAKITEKLLKKS